MRLWQLTLGGSLLSGLLLVLLFPPFDLRWLAPVALTPLLYALAHEPFGKSRFLWGWLSGFVFWISVCWWIQYTLLHYGGLNLPLSILALVLFAAVKALHLGVFGLLAGPMLERPWGLLAIPALWAGLERTHAPLGFTWLQLGNAGIDMMLPLRLAPVTGVYGVSFVFAALACGLTFMLLRYPRRQLVWLAPLAVLVVLPAVGYREAPKAVAVSMQPVLTDTVRYTPESLEREIRSQAFATLGEALRPDREKPSLLLWPEVPAPFYYYADAKFREAVTDTARLSGAGFVLGTVAFTTRSEPLNSAVFLASDGRLAGRYDKVHLVPFGEFVPPLFGWINKISSEAGDYQAGERIVVFPLDGHAAGAFICYESAFPDHVRQFVDQGAQVLLNLTNDGYFGRSAAREQHLLLARMRAVENKRWVLRSTNDGITAAVDPAGIVRDRMKPDVRMAGRMRFGWLSEKTPYTQYGDWFAWLCLAAGLAGAAVRMRQERAGQIP